MILTHPERLLPASAAIVAVLLLGLLIRRRGRGWFANGVSLLVRSAILAALVFFMLEPATEVSHTRRGALLAAVDLSRSVLPEERERVLGELIAIAAREGLALNALGFGDETRVLRWGEVDLGGGVDSGEGVDSEKEPSSPPGGDLASRPQAALSTLALLREGGENTGRLLLLSDGSLPAPSPEMVPVTGLKPLVIPLGGKVDAGLRALDLTVQGAPAAGETATLNLRLQAARETSATVVLSMGGHEVRRVPVVLVPGTTEVPLTLTGPGPGRHVVVARLETGSSPDESAADDPLDNSAAASLVIRAAPWVSYVCADERPLFLEALRAQGLEVRSGSLAELVSAPVGEVRPAVVVLDRIPASELSEPAALERLKDHLSHGSGLLYLPRDVPGEMFGSQKKPVLEILPLAGRRPPPPPIPEDQPEVNDPDSLAPPDPEARKREKKKAPSLGLVLVIDVSDSMREGGRIRLAKAAAVAAAKVLHKEDLIGIVAFNHEARVVLDLTKASDKASIERRIARIRAEGGTVFYKPLALVREMLEGEPLGIKHVIFLSDGDSHGDRPIKQLITDMAARGITLSTVGCGRTFNAARLSDMALWGRGKFQPAFSPQEIPQVFTIEVQRVIQKSGARRREDLNPQQNPPDAPDAAQDGEEESPTKPAEETEKPRPVRHALPAPYTRGIGPHKMQGVLGLHDATPRRGAWVSMATESGEPVLAHGFHGDGMVMAATLPFEGPWARYLKGWEDYQLLAVQMVRFLMPRVAGERFHVLVGGAGRAPTITVLDRRDRRLPRDGCQLEVRDPMGRTPEGKLVRVGPDVWRLVLDPEEPTPGLSITFGIKGQEGRGGAFVSVPPPPEVADRGLNLPGLESWARALGGHVSTNLPETLSVKGVADREQVPVSRGFLMWVVPLLFLDLLVKRLMPGRPFFRARSGITSHLESPFTPSSSATQSRIPRRS